MKRTLRRTLLLILCTAGAGIIVPAAAGVSAVHAQTISNSVTVCGAAGTYTAPTASAAGSLIVGGVTYPIATGQTVSGASLATSGANICVIGTFNTSNQLTSVTITANTGASTPTSILICGPVTNYTAATSSAAGSIMVNGVKIPIASGTTIGGATVANGLNVCIKGAIGSGGLSTASATSNSPPVGTPTGVTVNVCGPLSAYTAATGTAGGTLVIGGITFPIAAGTSIGNVPSTGTVTCASLNLGGFGGSVSSVTFSPGPVGGAAPTFTGAYTGYTAPTTTTGGSIIIGGVAYAVAPGSTLIVSGGAPLAATLYSPRHYYRGLPWAE